MDGFRDFARAALARAVRTLCQTAVAMIGGGAVGVADVDWAAIASVSVMAFFVSLLTSAAAGMPEVDGTAEATGGEDDAD